MKQSPEIARALLESLLTRVNAKITNDVVSVDVSRHEVEALQFLLSNENYAVAPQTRTDFSDEAGKPAETPVANQSVVVAAPVVDWDSYTSEVDQGYRLCIDFGTAFSKVCLVGDEDRFQKPLAIGSLAGHDSPLLVPSSVLVHDGRLYFGSDAIKRSRMHAISHRRIDALKQFLSKESIMDIDSRMIGEEFLDGSAELTRGEVLRLYCGYLTALAEKSADHLGHDPEKLGRRFARPAWDAERGAAAESFMKRMLSDCRIIADRFSGMWGNGISIAEARALLDVLEDRPEDSRPEGLILDSVLEATAAANAVTGSFEEFSGRRLLAVVDVGAGTTDFGLFVFKHSDDDLRVWELTKGSQVLRQAGDTLDDILASMFMSKLGQSQGSDMERRSRASIQNSRRLLKEELFANHVATYRTDEDVEYSITLEEFNNHQDVKKFSEELEKKFDACLGAVDNDAIKSSGDEILIVLTGGGASLPAVQQLLSPKQGRPRCREVTMNIDSLRALDANLPEVFPQMAVALGGAMEVLPVQRKGFGDLAVGARRTVYFPSFTGA